jgi:hypothetical protein
MTLIGALAILVGWLLISLYQRKEPALAPVKIRRRIRVALAFLGTWVLMFGMVAVVQARL